MSDLANAKYSADKNVRFKTPMLRSDLCNYSDAYIVVKGAVTVEGTNGVNKTNKKLVIKSNTLFRSCISKIKNIFIDNAEDLDSIMSMYSFLEYNGN